MDEDLNEQLKKKEHQLNEYVFNLKNDIFSNEAENLRKEIYDLRDKIDILKGDKEKQEIDEDLKIIEDLRQELAEIKQKFKYASESEVMQSIINYRERQAQAIEHLVQAYKQQADIIKNSVSKDKIKGAMREISNKNYNDYTEHQNGNDVKYRILFELNKKLLEGDE